MAHPVAAGPVAVPLVAIGQTAAGQTAAGAGHHQAESRRLSIALMWVRAHSSQRYWCLPFSTEQIQVGGAASLSAAVPHRAQATTAASLCAGCRVRCCVSSSTS